MGRNNRSLEWVGRREAGNPPVPCLELFSPLICPLPQVVGKGRGWGNRGYKGGVGRGKGSIRWEGQEGGEEEDQEKAQMECLILPPAHLILLSVSIILR